MAADVDELTDRLAARDPSLWPGAVGNHYAFVDAPRASDRLRKELAHWAESIDQETVLFVGQGPAIQAAKALAAFAEADGALAGHKLVICETTDPETLSALPFEKAFVVVAAKDGRRREEHALFQYARSRRRDDRQVALISDEASPLARLADELRLQRLFESDPVLPGAFSGLSLYGAIPAALLGYDLEELLGSVLDVDRHRAVARGIAIAEAALSGGPTLAVEAAERALPACHLVVSLIDATLAGGGDGGVLSFPLLSGASSPEAERYPLELAGTQGLGALLYSWQLSAAVAAHLLGIDPFSGALDGALDDSIGALLEVLPVADLEGHEPARLEELVTERLENTVGVLFECWLPDSVSGELEALQAALAPRFGGVVVRDAMAPAVSHTSWRLVHDGPPLLVVQVVPREPLPMIAIPAQPYDFATLNRARVLAETALLERAGRGVVRVAVDELGELI